MKKHLLLIISFSLIPFLAISQARGVKVGYVDMEYILEKVPSYAEAKNQLEQKAQKWKQEIETKKGEILALKESLKTERVLLTKELLEERNEEIAFLENELLEFQQKKFGPNGDLILQKAVLVKPIQDQVFNAVQDIAEAKKFDFILDKSSDLTILFAAKRLDISDQVVRTLVRAERKEQLTNKQLKEEQERDRKQDIINEDPELAAANTKKAEDKQKARQKAIDDRKQAAEERRKQALAAREAAKNGTVSDKTNSTDGNKPAEGDKATTPEADKIGNESTPDAKTTKDDSRKKSIEERQKLIDEKKKAFEEKRLKTIADREAAKKAKEDAKNNSKP